MSQVYIIKIEILFQNLAEQDISNCFLVNYLLIEETTKLNVMKKYACVKRKKRKKKEMMKS